MKNSHKFDQQSDETQESSNQKYTIRWSNEENRDFFNCIKYFGIDFQIMKVIISQKNYNQLMKKYHKIKRNNPDKLNYY